MIKKVANNETNQEAINLEPIEKIIEKLDYYRSLFQELTALSQEELDILTLNIKTFFNIKPIVNVKTVPEYLFRISINNRILEPNKLDFFTEIKYLLAPPINKCNYNRCNIKGEQVIYCATDELTAYWETKPEKGDVITISKFKAKPNATLNSALIDNKRVKPEKYEHQYEEVFHILNEFFIEVFTMPIERENPINYIFSAILSSEQLFYPIYYDQIIEAIIYPSVQRKMKGQNVALRNDLIFEKYDLIEMTTRFIVEDYKDTDPHSNDIPFDDLIASITIKDFDFENGKIIYPTEFEDKFELFRYLQQLDKKQMRFINEEDSDEFLKNLKFEKAQNSIQILEKKYNRNDRITVLYYNNGPVKKSIKYKLVEQDLKDKKCMILKNE
jgi:hypothetical protein